MAVIAYPMRKQKSHDICRAFVEGCEGGLIIGASKLYPGAAFFYGIDDSNEHLWREVVRDKREYFYCDNSYFDESRQRYFRVTHNATQHTGNGDSDCKRFGALGIDVRPWHDVHGAHILVCPQSDHFMRVIAGYQGEWLQDVIGYVGRYSGRMIRVRPWSPDKAKLARTLDEDLADAHCLVTWSSAAAISAVLRGVPVITSDVCAARVMGGPYFEVERLVRPNGRREWAGVLADNQWTLDEFRSGLAWRMLNG